MGMCKQYLSTCNSMASKDNTLTVKVRAAKYIRSWTGAFSKMFCSLSRQFSFLCDCDRTNWMEYLKSMALSVFEVFAGLA